MSLFRKQPGTALMRIDNIVDNLPFVVRRDGRIVAAFAKLRSAQDWAHDRSWSDESLFGIHVGGETLETWRDGESR